MWKNYFVIALRNLSQHKLLSSITIFGLALGLSSALLVASYISNEYSYDNFYANGDRLYRLIKTINHDQVNSISTGSNIPQGPTFKQSIPEVESYCRLAKNRRAVVSINNHAFAEKVNFADSNFFKLFSFQLLSGNAEQLLRTPNKLVLSEESAVKYFGYTDVIGKMVDISIGGKQQPYMVEAVMKNAPANSSIQPTAILPIKSFISFNPDADDWGSNYLETFLLLKQPANYSVIEKKFQLVFEKYAFTGIKDPAARNNFLANTKYHIQPMNDIHLNSQTAERLGVESFSDTKSTGLLAKISLLILFIAGSNFVIISLARSLHRKKEVGIRKVVGGKREQLVMQFMTESFLITAVSTPIALFFAKVMSPYLASFLNLKQGVIPITFSPVFVITALLILFLTALLAGFYPAVVLSGFKPLQVLQNHLRFTNKNQLTRSLIVLQFSISIFFFTATVILNAQYDFMVAKDIGYNTSDIVTAYIDMDDYSQSQHIKNILGSTPGVESSSFTNWDWGQKSNIALPNGHELEAAFQSVDETFLNTLSIPLIQGQNFTGGPGDSLYCLVTESFARQAHLATVINQQLVFRNKNYLVRGIIKDYQYATLKSPLQPMLLIKRKPSQFGEFFIRCLPGKKNEVSAALPGILKNTNPNSIPAITSLTQRIADQYKDEDKMKQVASFCALICILLSCTGLYGLVSLSLQYRTKEISIRKILGATVSGIIRMISGRFLSLVLIAYIISFPLVCLLANKWLQNFAYRISLSWWMFGLAGASVLVIAFLTIFFQSLKTALMNPSKYLRSE